MRKNLKNIDNKSIRNQRKTASSTYLPRSLSEFEQSVSLPTVSPLDIRSKIEQSKIKAEVSELNNPGTFAFYFPVLHAQSHLLFALYFLAVFKGRKGKLEGKAGNEKPRNNVFKRKI